MNTSNRWNKFWIGFVLGFVLPITVFMTVYYVAYPQTPFVTFVGFSFRTQILPKIMSLCVAPNLAIFYLFINKEYWYSTRGVIAATLFYAAVIGIVLFTA